MTTTWSPDHLRPPAPFDPAAAGYKDWLHVDVVDHDTGTVAILNASLDGAPDRDASRAVGTVLVDVPGRGWVGNLSIDAQNTARLGLCGIATTAVSIDVDTTNGAVTATADLPDEAVRADLAGLAVAAPLVPDRTTRFGSGWLGWYAMPRLAVRGALDVGAHHVPLTSAAAYADHSWGRWHWGEDVGWEWGAFLTPEPGPAFVLSRVTDRLHRSARGTGIEVRHGSRRRRFAESSVAVEWSGRFEDRLLRVPGPLAVLHVDRARPELPSRLRLRADDGRDSMLLDFVARSVAQLVLADTAVPGYAFLYEISGAFTCSGTIGGTSFAEQGLGVVERVE